MNQLACLCTEVNLQKIYHVPTRVGVANVRAQFEVDRRGDGAAAFARVRASTRGRSKSSTELANLGSNSPTFCTKTTAQRIQYGFSMGRTVLPHKKNWW